MFKKNCFNIVIIFLYAIGCFLLYNQEQKISSKHSINVSSNILSNSQNIKSNENTEIGILTIDKIQLRNPIYPLDSKHNNVEENVTLLKESTSPEDDHSIIILAAHSGTGNIAFFNRLDELKIDDILHLTYSNKDYTYQITMIEEQPKNGIIRIPKSNEKELVLTTCSQSNPTKQLVIISQIK